MWSAAGEKLHQSPQVEVSKKVTVAQGGCVYSCSRPLLNSLVRRGFSSLSTDCVISSIFSTEASNGKPKQMPQYPAEGLLCRKIGSFQGWSSEKCTVKPQERGAIRGLEIPSWTQLVVKHIKWMSHQVTIPLLIQLMWWKKSKSSYNDMRQRWINVSYDLMK